MDQRMIATLKHVHMFVHVSSNSKKCHLMHLHDSASPSTYTIYLLQQSKGTSTVRGVKIPVF